MNKPYIERRLFTEEQIASIYTNETQTGIILGISEAMENPTQYRLYLSYEEAKELGKQLLDFVEEQNT